MAEIRIQTVPDSALDGFGSVAAPVGVKVNVATITRYAAGLPETVLAVLEFVRDVGVSVLAAYIIECLRPKQPDKVYIGNQVTQLEEDDVVRAINKIVGDEK